MNVMLDPSMVAPRVQRLGNGMRRETLACPISRYAKSDENDCLSNFTWRRHRELKRPDGIACPRGAAVVPAGSGRVGPGEVEPPSSPAAPTSTTGEANARHS